MYHLGPHCIPIVLKKKKKKNLRGWRTKEVAMVGTLQFWGRAQYVMDLFIGTNGPYLKLSLLEPF